MHKGGIDGIQSIQGNVKETAMCILLKPQLAKHQDFPHTPMWIC